MEVKRRQTYLTTQFSDGKCVQMLHLGSYDNEPESFEIMKKICSEEGLKRTSKQHREIYLSDPRKVVPEKLKTVLCRTLFLLGLAEACC